MTDDAISVTPPAEFIYLPRAGAQTSRVYHVSNCNGRLDERQRVAVTEQILDIIRRLGFTLCKTCSLRYEKELKLEEHRAVIETYQIAALDIPSEFELRVYWHRGAGNPVEIWSSKTGLRD